MPAIKEGLHTIANNPQVGVGRIVGRGAGPPAQGVGGHRARGLCVCVCVYARPLRACVRVCVGGGTQGAGAGAFLLRVGEVALVEPFSPLHAHTPSSSLSRPSPRAARWEAATRSLAHTSWHTPCGAPPAQASRFGLDPENKIVVLD